MQTNEAITKRSELATAWARRILAVGWLVLIAVGMYGGTLHYELIFDDVLSITKNDSIRQLAPLFGTADGYGPLRPSTNTPLQARPLVNLTLALNYHFGQTDPWGYRLVNVIGHLIVALILWSVVTSTLRQPQYQGRFPGCDKALGYCAALVWMVHPTHQDTVIYLTQRTELQMGLCYILAIQLSIWYWQCTGWGRKLLLGVAAAGASAGGMLSKEMAASIPAMVALYEWTFIGGSLGTIWKRSRWLYVGLMLSWLPLAAIYFSGLGTPSAGFNNVISAHDYWLTQSNCFFHYWRLVVFPWPLILHYHVPTLHTLADAWPGVIGLTFYGIVTAILVGRRSVLGFILLWFLAVLSPTLIIPLPNEEIAERRLYVALLAVLPAIAIYLMQQVPFMVLGATRGYAWSVDRGRSVPFKLLAYSPIGAIMIVSFAIHTLTVGRLKSAAEIWPKVLEHQPHNSFALACFGLHEFKQGRFASGIEKLEIAYRAEPTQLFIGTSLVQALDQLQDYPQMLEVCRDQYQMFPNNPDILLNFATALEKNGLIGEAIERYRDVVNAQPTKWIAHSSLATLLAETGQIDEAIHHFDKACELHPDYLNCVNLFTLYLNAQQYEKAQQTVPLILKASLKENSAAEHERVSRELRQIESQLNLPR